MSDTTTPTPTPTPTPKRRTITLTGRPPVRIVEADWPVIASATDHDGQVRCQANTEWSIRVRRHADGRAIVYGVTESGGGGQYAGWHDRRGGELLAAGDDIAAAICRVGETCATPEGTIAECVADLPAEDLT